MPFATFLEGEVASAADGAVASLTTGLTSLSGNLTDAITAIAPIALGVVAAIIVWKFGVKFFKGLSGTRS